MTLPKTLILNCLSTMRGSFALRPGPFNPGKFWVRLRIFFAMERKIY